MRIAFIGTYNSIHFFRRTNWFAERGHEVLILSYEWELPLDYHPNADVRTFPFERGKNEPLAMLGWMREQVAQFAPDVLHVHKCDYPGLMGLFLNFSPMVFTLWDGIQVRDPRQPAAVRELIPLAGRKADVVTANSPGLLRETLERGVPEDRQLLTSWGLDRSLFNLDFEANRTAIDELRENYGITPGDRIIFSPRVAANFSNLDALMQAADAAMKSMDEPAHIIFASYAETADAVHAFAHILPRLKHRSRFHWRGAITDQRELCAHYQLSDVVVSLYSGYLESSPASLIEGMLCGAVPVAAHLPVLDFWIEDGVNGHLCDCRDVADIARALKAGLVTADADPGIRQANFDKVVRQADYPTTMRMVESLYADLAQDNDAGFAEPDADEQAFETGLLLAATGHAQDALDMLKKSNGEGAKRMRRAIEREQKGNTQYVNPAAPGRDLPPPPSGDIREYLWAVPLTASTSIRAAHDWLTHLADRFHYDPGYLAWVLSQHPDTDTALLREYLLAYRPFHGALIPLYEDALTAQDSARHDIETLCTEMRNAYAEQFRHHLKTDKNR